MLRAATPLLLLLAALALALLVLPRPAAAQFTQLTSSYLNVSNPADGFGPEDKLVSCRGDLVFLDLDSAQGVLYKFATLSQLWSQTVLAPPAACPSGGASLWPRDQGYVLAVTNNAATGNLDRLVALGGSATDSNAFYSDDCGLVWNCIDGSQQPWVPRHYSAHVNAKGALPGDPLVMAGGISTGVTLAQFHSSDGGLTWGRPQCAAASPCQEDCNGMSIECTLPEPDPVGSCSAAVNPNWQLCYLLPDLPLYPGGLVADWSALYYWLEPNGECRLPRTERKRKRTRTRARTRARACARARARARKTESIHPNRNTKPVAPRPPNPPFQRTAWCGNSTRRPSRPAGRLRPTTGAASAARSLSRASPRRPAAGSRPTTRPRTSTSTTTRTAPSPTA